MAFLKRMFAAKRDNGHEKLWGRSIFALNKPLEETVNRESPVFILGVARSGTTLAQRLLNTYEDILIWGEHRGVLNPLAETFYRGWEGKLLFGKEPVDWKHIPHDSGNRTSQAWLNGFGRAEWKDTFRAMLEALFVPEGLPGKKRWGFKEVCYGYHDRVVEFLHELYPAAIFVFVVRNIHDVLASRKVFFDQGAEPLRNLPQAAQTCRGWLIRNQTFYEWYRSGKIRSYWIRYEELINGAGAILDLFESIGQSFGERQKTLLKELNGRNSSFEDDRYQDRWKMLSSFWLATARVIGGNFNAELGYFNPPTHWWQRLIVKSILFWFRAQGFFQRRASRIRTALQRRFALGSR